MSYIIWTVWLMIGMLAYTFIAALTYRVLHIVISKAYGEGAGGTEYAYRKLLSQAKGASIIWPLSLGWLVISTTFEWVVIAPVRFVWTKIAAPDGTG